MSTRIVGHCREMNPAMVSRAQVTGVALAGELLKNAKKMVSAEFRLPCEGAKRLVEIRAAFKVKGYVEHYNNVRLNSAIGYITPKDMLAEYQQEIQAERDRKLEAAREQRKNRQGSRDGRNGLLPVGQPAINYPPKPPQNGALIEDLLGGIIYTALFGETPSTS